MQFTILTKNLKEALNYAKSIIPNNPTQIAYTGFYLEVDNGKVNLHASDGNSSLKISLGEGNEDGSILLPLKPIYTYVSTLEDNTNLTLSKLSNGDLSVKASGKPYLFRSIIASFPVVSHTKSNHISDLTSLANAIDIVETSAPKDTNAAQLIVKNNEVSLYATDQFRLVKTKFSSSNLDDFEAIVNLKSFEAGVKFNPNYLKLEESSNTIVISDSLHSLTTRTLGIPFPPVEAIIEGTPQESIEIPTEELKLAIKRLSSISEASPLGFLFEGSVLTLFVDNPEVGTGEEYVNVENPHATELKFYLRLAYLNDAIYFSKSDKISLSASSDSSPIYLKYHEPLETIHVIMPVKK